MLNQVICSANITILYILDYKIVIIALFEHDNVGNRMNTNDKKISIIKSIKITLKQERRSTS